MKTLSFAAAVVFVVIAGLQFNDPDPIYWVAVYGGTALIALGKGLGRYSDFWAAIAIGAVLAGLLQSFPFFIDYLKAGEFGSIFGDMRGPQYVEPTREFGGLLMALALLVFYVRR